MQRSKAFTLIELLVVIAIIAILAAILFPVFAQAKLAAKKAVCLSNMKEIDLAELMYGNDYDDLFAPGGTQPTLGTWIDWSVLVQPYIKNGKDETVFGDGQDTQGAGSVFQDPAFTPATAADQIQAHELINDWPLSSLANSGLGTPNWDWGTPPSSTQFSNPSNLILLAEGGENGGYGESKPAFNTLESCWVSHPVGPTGENDGSDIEVTGALDTPSWGSFPPAPANPEPSHTPAYEEERSWDVCTYARSPHYRYANNGVFGFTDGHVKSAAHFQIGWYKNIYDASFPQFPPVR